MASRSRSCPGASTRPADAKPGLAGPAMQVAASVAAMVPTNWRLVRRSGAVGPSLGQSERNVAGLKAQGTPSWKSRRWLAKLCSLQRHFDRLFDRLFEGDAYRLGASSYHLLTLRP